MTSTIWRWSVTSADLADLLHHPLNTQRNSTIREAVYSRLRIYMCTIETCFHGLEVIPELYGRALRKVSPKKALISSGRTFESFDGVNSTLHEDY